MKKKNYIKIIAYSSNHPIKNNSELEILLSHLSNSKIKITVVSDTFKKIPGIKFLPILNKKEFDKEIKSSTHYLSMSYEDNGITFYEAINYGLQPIFPIESPKFEYYKSAIVFSINNLKDASQKIKNLKYENYHNEKILRQNLINLDKEILLSKRSIKKWISWI